MTTILGINGCVERGHDASASLIIGGKIICAAEEERFIRKKHAFDRLPINSIKFCLDYANISISDVDKIGVAWNFPFLYKLHNRQWMGSEKLSQYLFGSSEYAKKIVYVDHHLAHACSTYFPSGYDDALVLVIDGQGEIFSTSIWVGNGSKLELIKGYNINTSLGYFYSAATEHIGFGGYGQEGKIMGLSAYGSPNYKNFLKEVMYLDKYGEIHTMISVVPNQSCIDEQEKITGQWHNYFARFIPKLDKPIHEINVMNKLYSDLAASVQSLLEDIGLKLVTMYAQKLNTKNVCIAGGVGLNCQLNGKILSLPFINNVFVQPAANDAGTSLGAALKICMDIGEETERTMNPYIGPKFNNKHIEQCVDDAGLSFKKYSNLEKEIATRLVENKIIAIFQDRMEFGPRALGNRSILANPDNIKVKNKVNLLKQREPWRPLAPAILKERQDEYIASSFVSPCMTVALPLKDIAFRSVPAIAHVNKTARIQTVTKRHNFRLWKIIKEFENLTGLPILLNTSFNIMGEPIVCTPQDAIESFMNIGLDNLLSDDYVVYNDKNIL